MKKISYEPRRNFFLSQIVKNLLRKWSVFVSTSNNSLPRTHCQSPAAPLACLLAMNVFGCRGGKKSKVSQRGALNLPSARKSANWVSWPAQTVTHTQQEVLFVFNNTNSDESASANLCTLHVNRDVFSSLWRDTVGALHVTMTKMILGSLWRDAVSALHVNRDALQLSVRRCVQRSENTDTTEAK